MRSAQRRSGVVVTLALMVSACAFGGASGGTQSGGTRPGLTKDDLKGLGSFTSTLGTANGATLHFVGDGTPASISVTDPTGMVWTLTLPPNALLSPETISMTPFSQVTAGAGAPRLTSGVSFEPDGLGFYDPPTLTVKAPGGAHPPLLMTARGDGSGLAYGISTRPDSIVLLHFSSAAAAPWPANATAIEMEYSNVRAEIRALLKTSNPPPLLDAIPKEALEPCPPSGQTAQQAADAETARTQADRKALDSFAQPEETMVARLLGADRALELAGEPPSDAFELAKDLTARVKQRALAAIKIEEGRPDHGRDLLGPLTRLLLSVQRTIALLGGSDDIPDAITSWVRVIVDDQIKDLKAHDYDAFRRGVIVLRTWAMLSGDSSGADPIFQQLLDLLRFRVTIQLSLDGNGNGGSATDAVEIMATVKPDANLSFLIDLSGSGRYTGGSINSPGNPTADKVLPDSFDTTVKTTQPDVCGMRMGLAAVPWGKDSEAFQTPDVTVQIGADGAGFLAGCVYLAWGALEQQGTADAGFPALFFTLNNKSATAVDETKNSNCAGGGSSYKTTLHVKIEHLA